MPGLDRLAFPFLLLSINQTLQPVFISGSLAKNQLNGVAAISDIKFDNPIPVKRSLYHFPAI